MGDAQVMERIAAWEAAGLIDGAVAGRLRAAEGGRPEGAGRRSQVGGAAAVFGPSVTIAEMFGYLGTAFVLAAWYGLTGPNAAGHAGAAAAFVLLGAVLMRGSARARRAAGVAFLVAIGATMGFAGGVLTNIDPTLRLVLAAAGGLVAAGVFRKIHPALLTQLGLLGGLTTLAFSVQQWVEQTFFAAVDESGAPALGGPDPIVKVALVAGWWLLIAVGVGLVGRWEAARNTIDADRRAALSRAWAGFVAVFGVTVAVTLSHYGPSASEPGLLVGGRILEPVIGDLAILAISAVLLERAFYREASAFVFPAGIGVIIALTDLNASYISRATSTNVGLLAEGLILLVVGFGVERLRRRVVGRRGGPSPASLEIEPAAAPASR